MERLLRWLKKISNLLFVMLLAGGFYFRIYGLFKNYSFWTDEAHVAIFVRSILERGKPVLFNGYSTGIYQWLWYWLSAVFAKFFGLNEFAIRLPSVVFGVLTIWAVYLLGKELFNQKVGFIAAVITAFLKIEILWSRQARPYQALQFFYILGMLFVYKLFVAKKFQWTYFFGFLVLAILATLMHGSGIVVFGSGFLFLTLFRREFKNPFFIMLSLAIIAVVCFFFWPIIWQILMKIGSINNLFYYRIFLWRNYSIFILFAFFSSIFLFFEDYKKLLFLTLPLIINIAVASFLLAQPFTRYFYPAFAFLILLASFGFEKLINLNIIKGKWRFFWIMIVIFVFFVDLKRKLLLKPQVFYSLNSDMQEIPEVDWKKIDRFVAEKLKENPECVFISGWNDHVIWYLGEGKLNYRLRKNSVDRKKDPFSGAFYISSKKNLEGIVKQERKGLIVLESWETELPVGSREFIRENLKKELEVDRLYQFQPRYWPVEVYSWGM